MGPALFIFVTVTVGIIAGYQLLAGLIAPDAERVRSRLRARVRSGAHTRPLPRPCSRSRSSTCGWMATPAARRRSGRPHRAQIEGMLEQARVPLSLRQLGVLAGVIGLFAGIGGIWLGGVVLGLPLAIAGVLSPLVYVHLRVKARREKLLRQLPGAFELMARVLRAAAPRRKHFRQSVTRSRTRSPANSSSVRSSSTLACGPKSSTRKWPDAAASLSCASSSWR